MALPDNLLCLFSGHVEKQDGSYVIEIPEQELEIGALEEAEIYRVAMLPSKNQASEDTEPRRVQEAPPVAEGDVVDVEIEDVGEQGDGIARVGPGYVVIVPDTNLGERIAAEITETRENMAFAEVVERYDRR